MAISRSSGMLTITVDSKKVEQMLTNLKTEIPRGAKLGAKKIAGRYAQIYLNTIMTDSKSIRTGRNIEPWTGRSFNMIRSQIDNPQRIGNGYGVVVPSHLIALDKMPEHHVKLSKGRSITRWALTKGYPLVIVSAYQNKSIVVSRHPWLNKANSKARVFVRSLAIKEINKSIRMSKR